MALFTQQGLLGSTHLGFPAILPGTKVAIGDTWTWQGNLLNIYQCNALVARFTLKEIVTHEDELCAHIVGDVAGWPMQNPPECTCELFFSLDRRMSISGTLKYTSASRTETIQVKVANTPAVFRPGRVNIEQVHE